MLDDLKYIHQRDKSDALGVAEKQWQQLQHTYQVPTVSGDFQNIVHSGMGGSALWAFLSRSWPQYTIPFVVSRDYDIPAFVNQQTLFIASSYSGNTEETLSSLRQAAEKGAAIVVITSGGKLADIARDNKYSLILLPKIDKPRYGALYGLMALVGLLESLNLTKESNATAELRSKADFIKASVSQWLPDVPTANNPAKQLALELVGKTTVIYSGSFLAPAAHKWKISVNENAKNVAWQYEFPEFNHNEFTGWTSHPTDKPFAIVYLQSLYDHERVKQRLGLSSKLLSGQWPQPHVVEAKGKSRLEHLLWTVAFGDFVSLYLAMLNNTNPIETGDKDIIERFKKELGNYDQ